MTINCVRPVVSVQYLRDKRPALDTGQPLAERLKYPANPYVRVRTRNFDLQKWSFVSVDFSSRWIFFPRKRNSVRRVFRLIRKRTYFIPIASLPCYKTTE